MRLGAGPQATGAWPIVSIASVPTRKYPNKEISTLCDRLFCLRCEREVLLCHCAVVRPIATRRWRELSRIVFVENSENRPWSNALSDQFHQNKFHLRSLLSTVRPRLLGSARRAKVACALRRQFAIRCHSQWIAS